MANKDLVSRNDNALSVENANKLLNLRERVKQNTALVSDEWLDRLIKWADENELPSEPVGRRFLSYTSRYLPDMEPFYKDYFPRDKEELRKVRGIYIKQPCIDELPDEFGNLTELESLELNGLTKFPSCILRLKKLRMLWLDNRWSQKTEIILSKEFAQLSQLRVLGLRSHHLKRFPKVIFKLNKLRVLSLDLCGLSSIPRGFEVLSKHMDTISLHGNPLKNVPTSLCKCKKLYELSLGTCKLNTLPKRFINLQNLQILHLGGNNFTELPQIIFDLKNLKYLSINWTLVTPEIDEKLQKMGIDVS